MTVPSSFQQDGLKPILPPPYHLVPTAASMTAGFTMVVLVNLIINRNQFNSQLLYILGEAFQLVSVAVPFLVAAILVNITAAIFAVRAGKNDFYRIPAWLVADNTILWETHLKEIYQSHIQDYRWAVTFLNIGLVCSLCGIAPLVATVMVEVGRLLAITGVGVASWMLWRLAPKSLPVWIKGLAGILLVLLGIWLASSLDVRSACTTVVGTSVNLALQWRDSICG